MKPTRAQMMLHNMVVLKGVEINSAIDFIAYDQNACHYELREYADKHLVK